MDFTLIHNEWVNEMKAKGCYGLIISNDYKNGTNQHHGTTSIDEKKSVNTTSNTLSKNDRPAAGIGGPSSPIEVIS